MSDEVKTAAEKAAEKPKKEKVLLEKRNGATKPKSGTSTGRIWDIADAISAKDGKPAPRKAVMEAATAESINPATAATQYGRWRKFHGLGKEAVEAKPEVKTEAAPS